MARFPLLRDMFRTPGAPPPQEVGRYFFYLLGTLINEPCHSADEPRNGACRHPLLRHNPFETKEYHV